jgi:NADP-dependent 3-hydroxy acid dehydrogenase YdfG
MLLVREPPDGASRGLSVSFARGLAKANCNLVITARDLDRLQIVASDLEQYGGRILAFEADVAQLKDVEAMVECAMNEFGQLNILCWYDPGQKQRGRV